MNSFRSIVHSSWSLGARGALVAPVLVALSACGGSGPSPEEDTGQAELAITQVPSDVRCIRVTANGGHTVTRSFGVTPGQSSVFALNGLPTGAVNFLGEAFTQQCSAVNASSVAGWISDPVSATLSSSNVASVTLVMHRNGRASVGVDFQDDGTCRASTQACSVDADCCSGLICGADSNGQNVCQTGTVTHSFLYAELLSNFDTFLPGSTIDSVLEIVDLTTGTRVRTVSTGARNVQSIAVSPDGARVYMVDATNNQIITVDAVTGALSASLAVSVPRDLALSADGATLYADSDSSFMAINTATNTVTSTLSTGSDTPLGLSLSPDGSKLGAPSTDGGSNPAFYLVNAGATLSLASRIGVAGTVAGCTSFPNDSVFTNTGRALLWDSNCDAIYQIDVAAMTQLAAGTINTGRDNGSSFDYNNALTYSPSAGRAFAFKESDELVVANPAAASDTLLGGFTGTTFVVAQTPAGDAEYIDVIHRFSGGAADTLDRVDAATQAITRGVYTFSDPVKSVRDMRIVQLAP